MENNKLRSKLQYECTNFVKDYQKQNNTPDYWREPLLYACDAKKKEFSALKNIIGAHHMLPEDFVENPKTVVTVFIPFTRYVIDSNTGGEYSSQLWDRVYDETNLLLGKLLDYLCDFLKEEGYEADGIPSTFEASDEDSEDIRLMSPWSHRHAGVIAGLGTFGINNMIITEKGSAGRMLSFVTNATMKFNNIISGERCRAKINGSCMECINMCPQKAITLKDGRYELDKTKCLNQIYIKNKTKPSNIKGGENCGKCSCGVYCSYFE